MISIGPRACPLLGLSPFELVGAASVAPGGIPGWLDFTGRRVALTQSCRTGILLTPEALALGKGDEVLMSAYNCGTEVDALLAAGLKVRCVDCDDRGFLNLQALENAAGPSTRALYVIHPFGWPQPLDEIDEWRKKNGILLIEDCALSLFSGFPDHSPAGSRGEVSIYSFPKSLPTPDGGAISWNTDWAGPGELQRSPMARSLRPTASVIKRWMRRKLPVLQAVQRPGAGLKNGTHDEIEDIPADYYFEPWRVRRACTILTQRLLSKYDSFAIREKRRQNYLALSSLMEASGFTLMYRELPDGVCPLYCPIRVERRDAAVSALAGRGITTSPWWAGGHRSVDWSRFPVACGLKRSVLPLPIHQQLCGSDMEYIADTIRSIYM
jgi:dTDP-4-amino-4,6-dideoxygalactose transaminase